MQLPIFLQNDQASHTLVNSGASHNFVTRDLATTLGVQCETTATVSVALADALTLHTTTTAPLWLQVIDDEGHLLRDCSKPVTCYVLDVLPSLVILGMPWLHNVNPAINWSMSTVNIGNVVVACVPSHSTARMEL